MNRPSFLCFVIKLQDNSMAQVGHRHYCLALVPP
jgi:hypothetical protein